MSFANRFTYAELYPSRLPVTYRRGSVFLCTNPDGNQLYLLAAVVGGFSLVCVTEGTRWEDKLIQTLGGVCDERTLLKSFYPFEDRFKFIGMAKDVLGLTARAAYIANKCGP